MIKAKKSDKLLICGLLVSAFSENQSVNYIISDGRNKSGRMTALMDYSFELCMRFGEVWLSDDRKGCALLLFPQCKRLSVFSVWLDFKLAATAIGFVGLPKVLRREQLVNNMRSKTSMAYLWFIGVMPLYQKSGIGSNLISQVLAHCKELYLPVLLETSVPENLPWYGRFGFRVYDELDLGYRLYFLAKSH